MASSSQAAGDGGGGRSGGKIVKRRRTAARKTPYDRPTPPLQPESPNWFNGLVSPAKFVVGGATKLLSSIWNPKGWGSHSSSSDSDSDSGIIGDDYEDNENLSDVGGGLNQKKGSSPGKSEILYLVEQLLMLESFSREECDRLIGIINSRVVECTMRDGTDVELKNPDTCNQAIMEARKLITQNLVGSSSKSDLDSIHGSKALVTPNIAKGEAGSPVDVAKSYMQARSPWVSPISHSVPPTPSPLPADLLNKGTPYSSVGAYSYSLAKRDYLSAGSWNIQEEVRRLRSKATEDVLSRHQSPKLAVEHDFSASSLANDKAVGLFKPSEPFSLEAPKPEEETVNLAADGGSLGFTDTRATGDVFEALSSLPTIEEQNQIPEDQDAAPNHSHHHVHPNSEQNLGLSDDVNRVNEGICDLITESREVPDVNVNGSQGSSNTNDTIPSTKKTTDSPTTRSVTRSRRYNRRGRSQAK
ncbi:protein KAKU4-like isoform X2 [Cynara cardunculus var. scolymus]|uniref:protein KAKU4-like isoform X2 n=1 Tax=Cynara cardunculus var. scolymus TaxID=59895 RepID=UPI000D62A447|nr:protein KAKU4-like isoform X2 [Cynara cardunculus var. scolymus]